MNKLSIFALMAVLTAFTTIGVAQANDDDNTLRDSIILLSTVMAPEITTYGPYTTLAGSSTFMRITEALENLSYNISVDSRMDKREIFDLRDDAVDFLAEGHKSTTFEAFSARLKKDSGEGDNLSDEQVASFVISVATFL